MERLFFVLQRLSTLFLIPFVLTHLGVILYTAWTGLSAAAILGRTKGSWGWILFYSAFVVCVSLHAPLGVRAVLIEWGRVEHRRAGLLSLGLALLLLILGLRAVIAVGGVTTP